MTTASRESTRVDESGAAAAVLSALRRMDSACVFGPSFFLGQLGHLVRERCPAPEEGLPLVQVELVDGDTLDICHIVAASPRWVMFAVSESGRSDGAMATEFVPYELIRRVRIRSRKRGDSAIGFEQTEPPALVRDERIGVAAATPGTGQTA